MFVSYCIFILTGQIDKVQGFISQTASLVDTTPTVDEQTALNVLTKEWKHSQKDSSLEIRPRKAQLLILRAVSTEFYIL